MTYFKNRSYNIEENDMDVRNCDFHVILNFLISEIIQYYFRTSFH